MVPITNDDDIAIAQLKWWRRELVGIEQLGLVPPQAAQLGVR